MKWRAPHTLPPMQCADYAVLLPPPLLWASAAGTDALDAALALALAPPATTTGVPAAAAAAASRLAAAWSAARRKAMPCSLASILPRHTSDSA